MIGVLPAIVVVAAAAPGLASCERGWYLGEGVRLDGEFGCYSPLPACCGESTGRCSSVACPEQRVVRSAIRCTGGARPIVVDARTVGCQR